MFNIIFETEYPAGPRLISELRRGADPSQRDMAVRLRRSQGHVHRMETGQRPIELVEFCRIAFASGVAPDEALVRLLRLWEADGCGYGIPPRDGERVD